ncbi:MAG TPA: AbrB/MazE/SpoVT family DNA-binding domain-containing protein [Dehalococcoidia bacterium]|nr:AbrB/MazE/SpoVT family DNA-binding domain-containing protein [Dehalococcoidia bacterium]
MARRQRLLIVQKRGQITIPADIRRRYGLEEGAVVSISEEEDGIRITPRAAVTLQALERIGRALRDRGVTLDELIAETHRGREAPNGQSHGRAPADLS